MAVLLFIMISLLVYQLVFNNNSINTHEDPPFTNENFDGWGLNLVNPNRLANSETIDIAILDSGIYKNHNSLKGIVIKQYNAISSKQEVIDDFGHGTAVAGIIYGISPNVNFYDVKILNSEGAGTIDSLIEGIHWSIDQGVDMINISSGVQIDDERLYDAIKLATSNNIIVIASAGNTYGLGVDYPAKYKEVISVNAINEDLVKTPFSAKGKIDVVGPGVDIVSTDNLGGYSHFDGSSFATAHVTGVISYLLKEDKEIEINEYIQPIEGDSKYYGAGIIKIE